MATQVGLSRSSTSRRVTKLVKAGYLERVELSRRQVLITLTQKAWNAIIEARKELGIEVPRNAEPTRPEPDKTPPPEKNLSVSHRHAECVASTRYNINKPLLVSEVVPLSRDDLTAHVLDKHKQLHDLFTPTELMAQADAYLDFCRGKTSSYEGFVRKLEAKQRQRLIRLANQQTIDGLAEAKRNKLQAAMALTELTTDRMHFMNMEIMRDMYGDQGSIGYYNQQPRNVYRDEDLQ